VKIPKWLATANAERLNHFAGAVQNIVVALGIIVGGIFALVKFNALSEFKISQLEVEARQQELTRPGVVNLSISLSQLRVPLDNGFYIDAKFALENVGVFRARFDASHIIYETYHMDFDDRLKAIVIDSSGSVRVSDDIDTLFLFPKERIEFNQVIAVPTPGLYRVAFTAFSENVGADIGAKGADTTRGLSKWQVNSYISLGEEK